MSRSYKKNPVCTDNTAKHSKRLANKAVRRSKRLHQGGSYKKVYESWNIKDYRWWSSREDAIRLYEESKPDGFIKSHYKDLDDFLQRNWYKYNKSK